LKEKIINLSAEGDSGKLTLTGEKSFVSTSLGEKKWRKLPPEIIPKDD